MTEIVVHRGGCHCGAVRFEVEAAADLVLHRCNCSICALVDYLHMIVPAGRFRLLTPRDGLIEYRFNTLIARHLFCRQCGIKSFYIPRSNPDGVSVNARCLDRETIGDVEVVGFDGANWEDNAAALRHLSGDEGS